MVPFEHLYAVVDALVTLFEQSGEERFEAFAANGLNRFSPSFVSMWVLLNFKTGQSLPLPVEQAAGKDLEKEAAILEAAFPSETIPHGEEAFFERISALAKELWTVAGKDPTYKPPIERTVFR
jgi:ferredoxin-nitrite reductase